MDSMKKLKQMICDELEEIAEKGEMSAGDLDTVYKLIVAKEKLLRAEEIEGDMGYSGDGNWRANGMYSRRDGDSYGRHYVRGHYSRRGYSMADGADALVEQMEEMMNGDELNSTQKTALRKAIEAMR